ncbi:MAG: MFS transporter [Clostridioides difficile]|nr:MFS transporter [Clostridioides difficile]
MSAVDNKPSIWKNFNILIILFVAGAIIYALPYLKNYYYDTFKVAFNLNNTQMGSLGSIYGFLAMVSYLFGGLLADRISARKLLSASMIISGLLGLLLITYPPYIVVLLIHGVWGVTTILTFWPALVKAVRMLASENEQGKAFGFLESGRGIVNALSMSLILVIFSYVASKVNDKTGLTTIIVIYAVVNIIIGILVYLKLQDNEKEVSTKFDKKVFIEVIKKPHTWLITIIMFCSYSMNMSFYYFTPYSTEAFGASVVFASAISILAQYCRPVASAASGLLGDKVGSSKIIAYGFILMIVGLLGVIFTPTQPSMIIMLLIACVAIYVSMYAIQGLHYSLLEEGNYPLSISGTAIGIVATLGYLPEVLCPLVAGKMLDAFPGISGYRYYFILLAIVAAVGLVFTIVWMGITKERRKELVDMNKKKVTN